MNAPGYVEDNRPLTNYGHDALVRPMHQMTAWARGVAINGVATGFLIGTGLWLVGVQPALVFGVLAFFGEFIPNIGAFLVALPILFVALSMAQPSFGSHRALSCSSTKSN